MVPVVAAVVIAGYPAYPPGGSCNVNGPAGLCIGAPASSYAVLQRAPAKAAIYGSVDHGYVTGPGPGAVTVTMVNAAAMGPTQAVVAVTAPIRNDRTWKAVLPPQQAYGNWTLTAQCTAGCGGANRSATRSLHGLTFGDVYVCAGQSNMQLMLEYTFDRNRTIAKIAAGEYRNIRLFAGPMNFPYNTNTTDVYVINANQAGDADANAHQLSTGGWRLPENLISPISDGHDKLPFFLETEFDGFYSTCWYTFEKLTDSLIAEGQTPPPFGLIAVAVGGTKIAQWVEWEAQSRCKNVTCCDTIDCTQNPSVPWQKPITHENCSGNGALYNGLINPLVNTTGNPPLGGAIFLSVAGWLWYQGENSLPYDAGSSLEGTGYACMLTTLIASWRRVWSAEPGTTDPLAPFAVVSLADGTDEGFGVNMRQLRWAITANYGIAPNPAMPNTIVAEGYDLGDPWHTPVCGFGGTFEGGPTTPDGGTRCCVGKDVPLGPDCVGDHRGLWSSNATRQWANLGPLHPRVKSQLGDRLAQGLHAASYGGQMIGTGPVLAGCNLVHGGSALILGFNATMLRGESVLFNSSNTVSKEDTALYVLVNDTVNVASLGAAMVANHHAPNDKYYGPFSDGNEMGVFGWVAVAATPGPGPEQLTVDLSHLPRNATVRAIRYAAGAGGYNSSTGSPAVRGLGQTRVCCGPGVDVALQPCPPERCPIKASAKSGRPNLPASPFFAAVDPVTGQCHCYAPQECTALQPIIV